MKLIKTLCAVACALSLSMLPVLAGDKSDKDKDAKAEKTCCEKAKADGKECTHKCCVAAHKEGKSCEHCNPNKQDVAKDEKKADKKADKKTDK